MVGITVHSSLTVGMGMKDLRFKGEQMRPLITSDWWLVVRPECLSYLISHEWCLSFHQEITRLSLSLCWLYTSIHPNIRKDRESKRQRDGEMRGRPLKYINTDLKFKQRKRSMDEFIRNTYLIKKIRLMLRLEINITEPWWAQQNEQVKQLENEEPVLFQLFPKILVPSFHKWRLIRRALPCKAVLRKRIRKKTGGGNPSLGGEHQAPWSHRAEEHEPPPPPPRAAPPRFTESESVTAQPWPSNARDSRAMYENKTEML